MAIQWGNNSALAGFQNALALGADIGGAIRQNRENSALAAFMTASGKHAGDVPMVGPTGAPAGALGTPAMPTQWGGNGGGIVPTETQKTESQAAYERLARINPRLAMQAQDRVAGQEAARAKLMQEQNQRGFEGLQTVGKLLEGVSDEATFQNARAMAQQNGIDLSRVPQNYDPAWVNGQRQFIQAMKDPKALEAFSAAGKQAMDENLKPGTPEFAARVNEIWRAGERKIVATQAGGGVAEIDPITGAKMVIMPNTGGFNPGTPVAAPSSTKTIGGKTYEKRGDQWFEVGGGSGNATGGF